MPIEIIKDEFGDLTKKIAETKQRLPQLGQTWTTQAVRNHHRHILFNLKTQGRTRAPKLSEATLKIYRNTQEPNGEGIRNHIEISFYQDGYNHKALIGIPLGKPSTVSFVQEHGAQIRVTPKMRRFLATQGIFLRADTKFITIPARKFWSRANTSAKEEAKRLLKAMFEAEAR